ncbi:hypothetical protein DM860_002843 [Cuscuta australis]|uniref:Transcription factor AS1 n=1 Tax=Cuscuta australis TaxID=267555 RepID=A0A328D2K7_9ASTE|nr:hypothetical protein DM860_002843 [Cuscuta australis]
MASSSRGSGFLQSDPQNLLPPWLSNPTTSSAVRPPTPSVALSLCPSISQQPSPAIPWLQSDRMPTGFPAHHPDSNPLVAELLECCRNVGEGHHAWTAHKKEAAWRLKRVELQLESEKASKIREKREEIDSKIKALLEEQRIALDRIEGEYREQLAVLRRDAEAKEQKLTEQWASKHMRLSKFLEQLGCPPPREANPQ